MSDQPIIQFLQQCTVRLSGAGGNGTGFFVAPDLILTCHHVVQSARSSVRVFWHPRDRTYWADVIHSFENSNPDLALLKLKPDQEGITIPDQPWVDFDQLAPRLGDDLYSYGYPQSYTNGDSVTFKFEGDSRDSNQALLYKLKEGQAEFGLSGSPLLNQRTGKVCGIVTRSRGLNNDLGGRAVPSTVILATFPDLASQSPFSNHTPLANPFRPLSGRVDNPTLFFNRERELNRIFETLNSGSSVALIGAREMGKSSILWAIEQQAKQRLQPPRNPIYINLQLIYSEDEFYSELCEKAGISDLRNRELRRELQKHRLLLLLDEVERITEEGFTRQVREYLRGLAEGSNAPLRLVLAASTSLDRLFTDSYQEGKVSPLVGICLEESIKTWNRDIVYKFIYERLAPTLIRFTAAEIEQIIQQSQGYPKRVMQLCHQTFAHHQESNP